jgi:predicted Zn-dependent protease
MRALGSRVLLLLAALGLAGCVSIDQDFRVRLSALDKSADAQVDVEAEVRFGRQVAARLLGGYDGVPDQELQRYVNQVGAYLVQFAGRDELNFHFLVIQSAEINAYALPGGYIFVTSAAVAAMRNEAELAGVLAHEIAHVREKHIVKALDIRGVSAGAALGQLTSGGNDAFRVALTQASQAALAILTDDGLQQEDEFDADELAFYILVQGGYDSQAYLNFLARIDQNQQLSTREVSRTHPDMPTRLSRLQGLREANGLDNLQYAVVEDRFLTFKR